MPSEEIFINKLLSGDITFFSNLDKYYKDLFCSDIIKNPRRKEILNASFENFKTYYPYHAFLLTCDLEEYSSFCQAFINSNPLILTNNYILHELLWCNNWFLSYAEQHLEQIALYNLDNIFSLIKYALEYKKISWIKLLSENDDSLIRIHTMYTIIDDFPYYFHKIYPNPLSLLTKPNNQNDHDLVEESYLSKIAILTITNLDDISLYHQIKNFILTHYPYNSLASNLDSNYIIYQNETLKELLIQDINELFVSSIDYKWQLYKDYSEYLDSSLKDSFARKINPFIGIFPDEVFESMSFRNLLSKFLELAYKYLELSTKAKYITKAGEGSCSYAYRVGDYIIKYSDKKYSSETDICPSLYLIAKNYEEIITRNAYGKVTGAIEVQRYYSKVVLPTEIDILTKWQSALQKEGYFLADDLVSTKVGNNCFRLDDYHEADTLTPEELPEWFKKDPVVLVDHDLVFRYKHRSNN